MLSVQGRSPHRSIVGSWYELSLGGTGAGELRPWQNGCILSGVNAMLLELSGICLGVGTKPKVGFGSHVIQFAVHLHWEKV
jgi:hypothetical protein